MDFLAITELHTDRTEGYPSGSAYNSNTKSPMPACSSHRGGHAAATATAAAAAAGAAIVAAKAPALPAEEAWADLALWPGKWPGSTA